MARPRKDELVDLSKAHELTAGLIDRLTCPPGKDQAFLRDSKAPSLRVRVTANGAKSFVFEAKLNRKTVRKTIGDVREWSIDGPEGSTNARSEANRLRVILDTGSDPRLIERQAKEAEAAKVKARLEAGKYTLKHLLDQYCDHLKALGRPAHDDARSVFKMHIYAPWPEIAALPATEVNEEQIADMMRKALDAGKGRTANKLRTYVRAAYQLAKQARIDTSAPVAFKAFNVTHNPAAETSPNAAANRADKNPLPLEEMRTYWGVIKEMQGSKGALLRLHLLTGGQRIEQLVRLKTANIKEDAILIFDGKGKPGQGLREHIVPLVPMAAQALKDCYPQGEYALSTDNGKKQVRAETLSGWAAEAAAAASISGFQTKRIRSGVETALAKAKISKDDRGRLQSHGISGVQARHYDAYDYFEEKLNALTVLFNLLEAPEVSNVVPIRAAG
jgi:integrase